ncbi:MAG: hypothetical protein OCD76_06785 [Reichenbachiella sp.]
MKTNVYFNTIYVIQSLDSDERQTGLNLFENVLKYKTWQYSNINVEVYDTANLKETLSLLEHVKSQVLEQNTLPYLHFEIHGSENRDGLVLRSGELLNWLVLADYLRDINIASQNNLFISMATCYGAYLIKAFDQFNKPCPFYGFIGPTDNIGNRDLEDSYSEYFTTLLDSKSFTQAISVLQMSNKENLNDYTFLNSEAYFDLVIENLQGGSERWKSRKIRYKNARNDKRFIHLSNNKLRSLLDRIEVSEEARIIKEMRATFTMQK